MRSSQKAAPEKTPLMSEATGKKVKLQPNQHETSAQVSPAEESVSLAPLPSIPNKKAVAEKPTEAQKTGAIAVLSMVAPPLPTNPVLSNKTVSSAGVFPISQLRKWVQQQVPNTAVLMTPNPSQASFFLKRATVGYPVVSFSPNAQAELLASLKEADYLLEERGTVASQWVESVQALSSNAIALAYEDDKGAYRVWKVLRQTAPTPPVGGLMR